MAEIGAFTPEQARELWQWYQSQRTLPMSMTRNTKRQTTEEFRPRHCQVILKADLFAAVDTKDDPSEAQATVLVRRNNKLVDSGRLITIINRFENISVDAGTYCKAEWIDGEWQLYAADCPGGSVSESSVISEGAGSEMPPPESF